MLSITRQDGSQSTLTTGPAVSDSARPCVRVFRQVASTYGASENGRVQQSRARSRLRRPSSSNSIAQRASSPQLLTYQRYCGIFGEIAARADAGNQRAQVIGADRAIDDLTLAYVCLGGVRAQDRGDLCVEIDIDALARSRIDEA